MPALSKCALAAVLVAVGCAPDRAPSPAAPTEPSSFPSTVPADMRAWFAERGVVLPAQPPAEPAAKAAQDERLLGDGSGNGRVNYYDLWGLWEWLKGQKWFSRRFDMDLLDINRNGTPEWVDLALLGAHLYDDPTPPNTYGIGRPLRASRLTASLSPDPTTVEIKDDAVWHRFTLNVDPSDARVRVVVNATPEATLGIELVLC